MPESVTSTKMSTPMPIKTSTTYMIKSIAEEAGLKVGLIGTIHNLIGDRIIETERTTPASVDLQKILRDMKNVSGMILVRMPFMLKALRLTADRL